MRAVAAQPFHPTPPAPDLNLSARRLPPQHAKLHAPTATLCVRTAGAPGTALYLPGAPAAVRYKTSCSPALWSGPKANQAWAWAYTLPANGPRRGLCACRCWLLGALRGRRLSGQTAMTGDITAYW